jgi:hypothetical protein
MGQHAQKKERHAKEPLAGPEGRGRSGLWDNALSGVFLLDDVFHMSLLENQIEYVYFMDYTRILPRCAVRGSGQIATIEQPQIGQRGLHSATRAAGCSHTNATLV